MITLKNPTFGSRGLLPAGYVQLHWIESSGTQKIDCGVAIPNSTEKVLLKFKTDYPSQDAPISGYDYGTWGWTYNMLYANPQSKFGWGSNAVASPTVATNTMYEVEYTTTYLNINGTQASTSSTSFSTGLNCTLFYANGKYGKYKLYYAKLYDGSTLVRNFIPCINPQNEVGMYDLVSQTFFGNSGTGVFIAGARVVDLPLGYTQLESISSTGTQWFDTGLKDNGGYGFECLASTTVSSSNSRVRFMGANGGSAPWIQTRFSCVSGSGIGGYLGSSSINAYTTVTANQLYKIEMGGYTDETFFKVDGAVKYSGGGINPTTNKAVYLFTQSRGNVGSETPENTEGSWVGTIRYARFFASDKTTLTRDFIPCISSTNEVGMYDLVSEQFFGNAGSGTFTAGSPVLPLYLYNEGDECEVVTGGWGIHQEGSNTITKNDADISLVATSSGKYGFISTNNTINTSNYSYIVVRAKSTTANNTDLNIRYSTSSSNTGTYVGEIFNTSETGEKSIRFATSSFNGKYVVIRQGISSSGGTCSYNVYQVWLEP